VSALGHAATLVAFPVVAAIIGAIAASLARPGAKLTSGVQHFAGGVVIAALAGEVLPDLRKDGHLVVVIIAFAAGVGFLIALEAYSRRVEARTNAPVIPIGLIVTVGIDLLIDGVLVGVGATLGNRQALIITIALTLEILFLALSVTGELIGRGASRRTAALVPSLLGTITAVGAIGGAAIFGNANTTTQAAVLAFGAAALLYLVTEELLTEAHETRDTPALTAAFFLGFITIYALAS
jgi:ZIP family zinc transporter